MPFDHSVSFIWANTPKYSEKVDLAYACGSFIDTNYDDRRLYKKSTLVHF